MPQGIHTRLILLIVMGSGVSVIIAHRQASSNSPVSAALDVQAADLLVQPPGANWPSYNGDYTGRRYCSLDRINIENAGNLRAAWVFHSSTSDSMEVTPVVISGLMFVTSANDAFALDARTGRVIWHFSRAISQGLIDDASAHHNRGVGVWRSRIYLETDNAHLLCLDARSGNLVWDVRYADSRKNYELPAPPWWSRTRCWWVRRVVTMASEVFLQPSTRRRESSSGDSGRSQVPAKRDRRAGLATNTCWDAVPPGCRGRTIRG